MAKSPFTKRLKQARAATEISQKKLGIAAGIDEFSASARMNQYETGKHIPDFLTLSHIAKALDLPTAYFYANDDELAEALMIYHRLSSKKKKQLLSFIKELES